MKLKPLSVLMCIHLLGLLSGHVVAGIRPSAYGGGSSVRTSTESVDEYLDPIKIQDRIRAWEVGGGFRIFPNAPSGVSTSGRAPWEFRIEYGRGGSSLPGSFFQVTHVGHDPYSYSVKETYSQTYSIVRVSFLSHVRKQVAVLGGPAVQSVTFRGTASSAGVFPQSQFGQQAPSGSDKKDVLYGLFGVGIQWSPLQHWPSLEVGWTPARFQLSTNRRASATGWQGTFPDFKNSVDFRVAYTL